MFDIKEDELVKTINNKFNSLLGINMYAFRFNPVDQSIYVQDNHSYVLCKSEIETLIKGLQNSLENFPEEEFKEWNVKQDNKYFKDAEEINNTKYVAPPKQRKHGYIYFMQDESNFVKIGLAADVRKRFKTIKSGNPTLQLIHQIKTKDMELTEKLFHSYFNSKRINGEWFNLNLEDIEFVKYGLYPDNILASIEGESA